MVNQNRFLIILIGFLIFSSATAYSSTDQSEVKPTPEKLNATTDPQTFTPEQQQSRRELKAMLWASIIILVALFVLVFILFIFRMARVVKWRHQLGKKKGPTEYIDAWSQYRLPDDPPIESPD